MAKTKNEFEELETEEAVPEQEFSAVPGVQADIISAGNAGTKYDWTKAPEGIKAPPRIDLDGKTVTIKKAEIILPPMEREWQKTKDGTKDFKYCTFALYYDEANQQEFYSGMRVFKREDNKYSHPTLTRDRKNQASQLLGLYADFKKKDVNEIPLREFLAFLNSTPKAKLKTKIVNNPQTGEEIRKNFVDTFV